MQKKCNLEDNINNITIIFDDDINSCENMFKDLLNIKEVDLSNFDASKVTSMLSMFNGCNYLEKITFGNINTYSLQNMEYFFHNRTKLK